VPLADAGAPLPLTDPAVATAKPRNPRPLAATTTLANAKLRIER
jgi:hypothetical protein